MRSSVTSGRRPASWPRYRRAQSIWVAQTQTPDAEEPVGRPEQAVSDVYYRDSILLHSVHRHAPFICHSKSLGERQTTTIVPDVKFLAIAVSQNHDTMGQRCKGGAVQSDGCACTSLKEGAHARS